jgi:DHA2 family multidrug resistance protein-like MFS transporter
MTPPHSGHPRRWPILGVLVLALFGIAMDNTVLVIALPVLSRDLQADTSQLQWLIDAYTLVFAGLLLVTGALSDRFGRRLLLIVGLAIFGLGSVLTPLVATADQLILLRAFMGLGASCAMPPTLSIIADVFDAAERPRAIAVWSGTTAMGIVAGPILGGALIEHFPWWSVFVVNVPVVAVGLVAVVAIVPESRAPGHIPMDPIGAVLSVVALTLLTYGIIEAPGYGWSDVRIFGSLGVAVALGIAFWAWERRVAHPMLDIDLFRNMRFTAACLSVTLSFFALNGALFLVTMYLQQVRDLSPLDTGYRFVAIAVGFVVMAPTSAWMTTRFGARITTSLGLAIVALGMALVATLGIDSPDPQVVGILVVTAAGIALAMTPVTDAIMGAVPPEKFGVGSAVNDTTRELGGALGIAILGSVFQGAFADRMAPAVAALPAPLAEYGSVIKGSFAGAAAVAARMGDSGSSLLEAARHAFVDAQALTSEIGVFFAIAGVVVAIVFLPARAEPAPVARDEETGDDGENERPEVGGRPVRTPA